MDFSRIIAILLSIQSLIAKSPMLMINEFAKVVEFDPKYARINTFKFYKKSRTLAALNVSYTLMQDIVSDEQCKTIFKAFQLRGNEYKRTVIDFSLGICALYKLNKFNVQDVVKNSNISDGCPFAKGNYYINDISLTAEYLPSFFPEGKWLLEVGFTYYSKVIARIHWMLSLVKNL